MSLRPRVAVAGVLTAEWIAIADWLTSAGFEPFRLVNRDRLANDLQSHSLDLLMVDFASAGPAINAVRARGSLTSIIVVGPADPAAEAYATARDAIYLTRPLDRTLLTCMVSMAIAESRPVRRSQRKATRLFVVVQGVGSQIIDVSREGMRLEIPRKKSVAPPPPMFNVSVPMLGLALNVRRLWIANPPEPTVQATWYGGELSNNSTRAELAWFTLVDTLTGSRTKIDVQ
jgi:hypothetical protein